MIYAALVPTMAGMVQVDVLEVSDADLDPFPTDPSDRLHVLSHEWAARSAAKMSIRAGSQEAVVAVAEPGPLVATAGADEPADGQGGNRPPRYRPLGT